MSVATRAAAWSRSVDPVPTPILPRAVFYTKSKGSAGVLTDLSGLGHIIQHGSGVGADAGDPLWLPLGSAQHLYRPGSVGNYASSPDSAAVSITSDLDLRVQCALDSWAPGAFGTFISKWGAAGNRSFWFGLDGAGRPELDLTADGTTVVPTLSGTLLGLSAGTLRWVRVTWRASDGRAQFFTSIDGSAWTQLGADRVGPTGSIFDSTAPIEIGTDGGGASDASGGAGKFYRAQILNGIGGTVVFDADFTDTALLVEPFSTFLEKSANGATVTINRSASGRKSTVVDQDLYLFGADDFLEIADAADLDPAAGFTVAILCRLQGTSANQVLIAKKADFTTDTGWSLDRGTANAARFILSEGTHTPSAAAPAATQGVATLIAGVRQVSQTLLQGFAAGSGGAPATDTAPGSIANANVLRIGRLAGAGTSYGDFVFLAAALVLEELSAAELVRLEAELRA